jgi:hypothetical protein
VKIDEAFHYDADPDTVVRMLADPEFQDRKAVASGALRHDVEVSDPDGAAVTTVTRTMAISGVPDFFSKFVSDSVEVTEVVHWDAPSGGSRTGAVRLSFDGQPMVMKGTITLTPAGDGTDGRMRGDLKCSIPLLGGKAEKALAPQIIKGLQTEVETGQKYLAERS